MSPDKDPARRRENQTKPRRQGDQGVKKIVPICDGTCVEPFLKAVKKHFGRDAELPVSFTTKAGKMQTIITPPEVRVRDTDGRRWKRTMLILPFCGICGKKTS